MRLEIMHAINGYLGHRHTGATALLVLALFLGLLPRAEAQGKKQRAIAELKAAGLSWDEETREVEVTDEGRARLKDLSAVLGALRVIQPRSLDLSMCEVLQSADGLGEIRSLQAIYLSACPALKNVDGIAASDRLRKIYLFESANVSPASVDALVKRFPKCYLVLRDGTGINPPRDKGGD